MSTIALVGNPNCGKTTLFNALTGSRQHVGNWPGVTVEKKVGKLKYKGEDQEIVDLPGTYSLGAYSEDEVVARNFIIKDKPDVVINVVDATNIERNLYLTTQLLEMDVKVIIALNMMDEAKGRKIYIDVKKLSKELGVPIIPMVATKKEGMDKLIVKMVEYAKVGEVEKVQITYGTELQKEISILKAAIEESAASLQYPSEWTAIKLLENDEYMLNNVKEIGSVKKILSKLDTSIKSITKSLGYEPEMAIVDKRYEFIGTVVNKSVKKTEKYEETKSDKIDKIVTNKWLGIPIFGLIMYLLYQATFVGGQYLSDTLDEGMGSLAETVGNMLANSGASETLTSFITDGLIGGVGAVVVFLPIIMVMYFLIGILEDSGYMARAAYVMDRVMRALGLHGKTFVSMIIGSGCNVPGIMAARTLESKKDRMIAILINPFVSCGARLPIYLVFTAAFFPKKGGTVLFVLYVVGILVALLMGKIFSKTLFKGESSYFVMELPPYRIPSAKNALMLMWEKAGAFLKKAGMIIFPVVTLLWILSVLPFGVEQYSEASILGRLGAMVAPIFKPAGFGTWQAGVGLFTGIVAKEAVVATLGMVYAGVEEGAKLTTAIQGAFTPLTAFAFMIMTLLYTPCAAALGAIKRETNSYKWTLFAAAYTFAIGWVAAVLVFQVGRMLGFQ
ncbi:ferrous iron transport protein B [Clostridium ganghwense]|uniref:Ferrous iron transport protein B n=1 Tax=Clostridium ganghwense TaxID=312089 RepID=A0ABT4CKP2_9CLOT|nr:ferrous iron transport protein B [Clostridium ganghwense]MCY6369612.1 ferrous iron transport protein B [Clostridium ganghwense]